MKKLVAVLAALLIAGAAGASVGQPPSGEIAVVRESAGRSDIVVVRAPGGRVSRALTRDGKSFAPAWSPDGDRLAYVSEADGDAELWVIGADGRDRRRITRNGAVDTLPAWSPDGSRVAFASDRTGAFEIWIVDAGGARPRRVTRGSTRAFGKFHPAWAPDGSAIVFASGFRTPENEELYVVRPDGGSLRRLTRTAGDVHRSGDDSTPAWSPDGRRIVFASNRAGLLDIWTMRADGSGQRRLAGFPRRDDDRPSFSHDGRFLAFASRGGDGRSLVYVVRADGSAPRRLAAGSMPAWRPS